MGRGRRQALGLTTIEIVIVLSLFGFVLIGLVGLHFVALSTGTVAETSSIAMNLARARMEELLALAPDALRQQNDTEQRVQVPRGTGRVYHVRTTIVAVDPVQLDLVVTASWQLMFGTVCGQGPGGNCLGMPVTYSRTLMTRVQAQANP